MVCLGRPIPADICAKLVVVDQSKAQFVVFRYEKEIDLRLLEFASISNSSLLYLTLLGTEKIHNPSTHKARG